MAKSTGINAPENFPSSPRQRSSVQRVSLPWWRPRAVDTYNMEYGYSCMGYEISGALGVKYAIGDKDVYAMCGDGSFIMLHAELLTAFLILSCVLLVGQMVLIGVQVPLVLGDRRIAHAPPGAVAEYGYSCMGYEISGALGVKYAIGDKDVYAMCGDGSFRNGRRTPRWRR